MNTLRTNALKLRLDGKSYNEIHAELGVPKSTLSFWFRDLVLSDEARRRLEKRVRAGIAKGLVKRNKMQTHLA